MGYEIEHAVFRITIKNDPQLLDICKQFHCGDDESNIIQAFRALRYIVSIEGENIRVHDIVHQFKWHGDEVQFWDMLAPYINTGYIIWFGEDNAWRYIYDNGVMSIMSQDAYVSYRTYEILPTLKNISNLPETVQKFIDDIDLS